MSSGPTMTGSTCIEATKRHYLNFSLERKDFCTYSGQCKIDDVLMDPSSLCLFCKYKMFLDIPKRLDHHAKEKEKCKG